MNFKHVLLKSVLYLSALFSNYKPLMFGIISYAAVFYAESTVPIPQYIVRCDKPQGITRPHRNKPLQIILLVPLFIYLPVSYMFTNVSVCIFKTCICILIALVFAFFHFFK